MAQGRCAAVRREEQLEIDPDPPQGRHRQSGDRVLVHAELCVAAFRACGQLHLPGDERGRQFQSHGANDHPE